MFTLTSKLLSLLNTNVLTKTPTEHQEKNKFDLSKIDIYENDDEYNHCVDVDGGDGDEDEKKKKVDNSLTTPITENKDCFKKTGIITKLESNFGLIDERHYFPIAMVSHLTNIKMGSHVLYWAEQKTPSTQVKIIKITEDTTNEVWGEIPTPTTSSIVKQNNDNNNKNYYKTHQRIIICEVLSKNKNLITFANGNKREIFDLETVESQFVPRVGDMLSLICMVESDELFLDYSGDILNVLSIKPLESTTDTKPITFVNERYGVIDNEYFFFMDIIRNNYKPKVGDLVTFDAIDSCQKEFNWRCINIGLTEANKKDNHQLLLDDIPLLMNDNNDNEGSVNEITEKNGITMTSRILFDFNGFDETTKRDKIIITNNSTLPCTITRACFHMKKSMSQLNLITPTLTTSITIQPSEIFEYLIEAKSKYKGVQIEKFVIYFTSNFNMYCLIEIRVNDMNIMMNHQHPSIFNTSSKGDRSYTLNVMNQKHDFIPGGKISVRKHFIQGKIANFTIPDNIKSIVLENQLNSDRESKLDELPVFQSVLTFNNYEQKFDALLSLEEIEEYHYIRRYDMDAACFTHEKDYLALAMENVFETRPSIVVGDSVRVVSVNQINEQNPPRYQGNVHKVMRDRILLKFEENFHRNYQGEDYQVQFYFSRTSMLKMHHAIRQVTKNLGPEFLFPTKINLREPQLKVEVNADGDLICHNLTGDVENIGWYNDRLNVVQKEAVKNILEGTARPMPYVILGPPGTGKTMTIIETILQITTKVKGSRIIVVTPSNSAANLIAERLIDSKVLLPGHFVRLVGYNALERELIPDRLHPYCITCDLAMEGTSKDMVSFSFFVL